MSMATVLPVEAAAKAIPSRHRLPGRWRVVMLLALVSGCAGSGGPGGAEFAKEGLTPEAFPLRPETALEVRLAFDGAADLDLHVTDPRLETVYFGNSPSRGGGRLDRDVRCDDDGDGDEAARDADEGAGGDGSARTETVRFDAPAPGRYRVGVDYVKACRLLARTADYALRVVGPGLEIDVQDRIGPGEFDAIALEFDWPPQNVEGVAD